MTIKINWRGKTRETMNSKMLALYEMGDISGEAYQAFVENKTVVRIPEDEADTVIDELERWNTRKAAGIDPNTVDRKLNEINKQR